MAQSFYVKYRPSELPGLPKYVELRETLRAAIADRFWKEGEQLPPELEIAHKAPFSLGTVQRALQALEEEGLLERRQGHGTFVTNTRARMVDPWHFRFRSPEGAANLPVYPRVVSKRIIQGETRGTELLCPRGGSLVQINRKINIGDKFLIYSKFFLPADKYAFFMQKSNKELSSMNFKTILHRECNVSFTRMSYTMRMVTFPDSISGLLKVSKGAVGLLLEILASSDQKGPVYFQEVYIPRNKFQLCITDSSTLPKSMS